VLKGEVPGYPKMAQRVQRLAPVDDGLFQELRAVRHDLAEEQHVPPFVIFSDQSLKAMCEIMPTDDDAFLTVKGVGLSKLTKYGAAFMAVIRSNKAD